MIPKTHGTIWSLLIVSFNLQQSIIFYKIIIRIWSGCSLRTTSGFLNGCLGKEGGKSSHKGMSHPQVCQKHLKSPYLEIHGFSLDSTGIKHCKLKIN